MSKRGLRGGISGGGEPIYRALIAGVAAFLVSVLFFAATALVILFGGVIVLTVIWALICFAAVVVAAWRFGPQYGVPLAIAAGIGYDSFYIPPYRSFGPDVWQNWIAVAVYLGLGVVLGGLAAGTRRRAHASESARDDLAQEQAALRRVATLVARGAPPAAVFAAVAEEVGRLFVADTAEVDRYEGGGEATGVGSWRREDGGTSRVGGRAVTTLIHDTGRPARIDGPDEPDGRDGWTPASGGHGKRSAVGAPIVVDGRVWGALQVTSAHRLPPDIDSRLVDFTELAAMAIANAEAQAALTASRARIVVSADETRRRIERDLHDGAQQRLVTLALRLRAAQAAIPAFAADLDAELEDVIIDLNAALDELREFARGIHPAILADGGLGPALRTLARRSTVPVELEVRLDGRLPEAIEIATYFVVSEAVTNAAKHANPTSVVVDVAAEDGALRLHVNDDGIGGASLGGGSGLVGLKDRVEALGGRLDLHSEAGDGTAIAVELPLSAAVPPPIPGGLPR